MSVISSVRLTRKEPMPHGVASERAIEMGNSEHINPQLLSDCKMLGVYPDATIAELTAAYQLKLDEYSAEKSAELGQELRDLAATRRNELTGAHERLIAAEYSAGGDSTLIEAVDGDSEVALAAGQSRSEPVQLVRAGGGRPTNRVPGESGASGGLGEKVKKPDTPYAGLKACIILLIVVGVAAGLLAFKFSSNCSESGGYRADGGQPSVFCGMADNAQGIAVVILLIMVGGYVLGVLFFLGSGGLQKDMYRNSARLVPGLVGIFFWPLIVLFATAGDGVPRPPE
jgi:hypothetical protein